MARLELERSVVDAEVLKRTAGRFRQAGVVLPTIAQLKDPSTIPTAVREKLRAVEPDAPHPLNLFRVHWFNDAGRKGLADVPAFVELPEQLTGVKARIVLLLGNRFPMIRAHKVLAAYGCLIPRIASGEFDPTRHRAVWPSTRNYSRKARGRKGGQLRTSSNHVLIRRGSRIQWMEFSQPTVKRILGPINVPTESCRSSSEHPKGRCHPHRAKLLPAVGAPNRLRPAGPIAA